MSKNKKNNNLTASNVASMDYATSCCSCAGVDTVANVSTNASSYCTLSVDTSKTSDYTAILTTDNSTAITGITTVNQYIPSITTDYPGIVTYPWNPVIDWTPGYTFSTDLALENVFEFRLKTNRRKVKLSFTF